MNRESRVSEMTGYGPELRGYSSAGMVGLFLFTGIASGTILKHSSRLPFEYRRLFYVQCCVYVRVCIYLFVCFFLSLPSLISAAEVAVKARVLSSG
jgi:hypothetical protein